MTASRTLTLLTLLAASHLAHADPLADSTESGVRKRSLTYVGCFSSSTPLQEVNTWQYQSQGYCQTHCNGAVIGLTNGNTCFCGNEIPATSSRVDDSQCSTECTGWGQSMCGGNGFWTVYLTGTGNNVQTYSGSNSKNGGSSSSTGDQSSSASSTPPTVVTSEVSGGSTVVITVPATSEATAGAQNSSGGGGGGGSGSVAGIAAGVVVGIVALAAIIAGAFFFLRHRRQKKAEEDYRQRSQVADFMRSTTERKAPGTSYSGMSDSRLDPEAGRRNSVGSLADNQDYTRRILRVANPDSS